MEARRQLRERLQQALVCPYCKARVDRGSAAVTCGRETCGALYHRECWEECTAEHGHCAVFGCPSVASREVSVWGYFVALVRRKKQEAPRTERRRVRPPSLRADVTRRLRAILRDQRGEDDFTSASRLVEWNDSIDDAELVLEIEEEFGISIPDEVAGNMPTVGDLIDFVTDQLADRHPLKSPPPSDIIPPGG